jgi:hypothetical protein
MKKWNLKVTIDKKTTFNHITRCCEVIIAADDVSYREQSTIHFKPTGRPKA